MPVHFTNQETCPGVKKGGSVNVVRHSIEMRVPADAIPESVTADLADLDINGSLHLTALPLPAGCKPTQRDRDFTIVTITPPLVVPEDPAAVAAAAAAAPAKGAKGAAAKAAPAPAAAAPAPAAKKK